MHRGGRCLDALHGVAQPLPGVFSSRRRCVTACMLPRAAAAAGTGRSIARVAGAVRLGQRGGSVLCQAAASRRSSSSSSRSGTSKRLSGRGGGGAGFGRSRRGGLAGKQQQQLEPWEAQLPAPYRVYYKPGFKPSRYWGPIELQRQPGGAGVGVSVSDEISGGQLLLLSHPVAFLDGGLGSAPAVEDLHVALLEAELPLNVQHVLSFLPQRPVGAAAPPLAEAPAAAAVDAHTGGEQQEQQEQPAGGADAAHAVAPAPDAAAALPPPPPYGGKVPQNLEWLVPSSWDVLGLRPGDVTPLTSRQLMRMLQLSSWSEEFRDPAASQVRHERPNGFIGLWPEWAVLRHSCAPNTSVAVVDKYLLLHATTDMQRGTQLTTNKLGSAIALPLAARQAAHWELFGGPCRCERCTLEQQALSPEATATLQDVADKAQGEWQDRLQAVLGAPSAGTMTDEEAADALTDLQAEITDALLELDDVLEGCVPDKEQRLLVGVAAYAAHDLAWQMEELLMEEPDLDKLAACVALQRMFARGTDSHVYSAMLLNEAYTQRAQEMAKAAEGMRRRTAASQRRLTEAINKLLALGNMAQYVYAEAVACRYGLIPSEGLLPRLEEGMSLFYAGLSAMSAAQSEGLEEVPDVSHNLMVDGIPVVVVDKVDGSLARADSGGAAAAAAPATGQPRLSIEVVEESGSSSVSSAQSADADSGAMAAAVDAAAPEAGVEDVATAGPALGAVADNVQPEPVV